MATERIRIELGGAELTDLYPDLLQVEVELDEELPGMFRIRLPLTQQAGRWTLLDDARFGIWNRASIAVGFGGDVRTVLTGRVTHVRPSFALEPEQPDLEIWGLDESVTLDRTDRLRDWPNRRDSDIATEILTGHGLAAEVQDTPVVHDQAVSTVIQRESDWRFLQRLAARNGFRCWITAGTGHFARCDVAAEPQAVLAVRFGGETTVARMAFEIDGTAPAAVSLSQLDRVERQILSFTADDGDQRLLGARRSSADPAAVVLARTVTTGRREMEAVCRSVADEQAWFVTGDGEIAANATGIVLEPRRPVVLKGVGELLSGSWLVSHVTHVLSRQGYVQRFRVKRNGLGLLGSESFSVAARGGA